MGEITRDNPVVVGGITRDNPVVVDKPHDEHVWAKQDYEQREIWAELKERRHVAQPDNATEAEHEFWFGLSCQIVDKKTEIRRWELMPEPIPSEALTKKQQLCILRAELLELEARFKVPWQGQAEIAPECGVGDIDYSLLATPDKLLDAFEKWGLKSAWFKDLNSHKWLLDARRRKGQGQRGQVIKPLFCPFAVMNGLIESVRKDSRLQPDTVWRILQHKFPKVYDNFQACDQRDPTGH